MSHKAVMELRHSLAWLWHSLVNSFSRVISSVSEYFLGNSGLALDESESVEPPVEDDGSSENRSDSTAMNSKIAGNGESASTASSNPVFNITIPSNAGTIIIGDSSTVKYVQNVGTVDYEKIKNVESPSSSRISKMSMKYEPSIVNLGHVGTKKRPRRKKTSSQKDVPLSKVSCTIRRIDEIKRSLSKFRGNGKWLDHSKAVEGLMHEFRHKEDNTDIMLVLKFERAACLYEKNEIEMARKLVVEISKEINKDKCMEWEKINDIQKMIYCKCLFLISKMYCIKTNFGKSLKALETASRLLGGHLKNDELEVLLYLAYAWYQFSLNQINCSSVSVNHVIDYANKAQKISARFKEQDQEKWMEIRREILLLQCKAITQFYLVKGDNKEFDDVFNCSMKELEHDLWDGIFLKQKVDFHILKSDYFKIHEKWSQSLDEDQTALQIAQKCEFGKDVSLLNDRIRKLTTFPEESVNDSEGLMKRIIDIQTTTDGNVGSNAAQNTDLGIFSTDESDCDIYDFLPLIAKARSLALKFMSAHCCCVRAVPYENEDKEAQVKDLIIRLYTHTSGNGISQRIKKAAEEMFTDFEIDYCDLQRLPLNRIVTQLPPSAKKREKELLELSKIIEENLHVFENRLNVTAVQASYKVTDAEEKDQLCVKVFVLGKGQIPAGETSFDNIEELRDHPYDIAEGYYQPAGSSFESYANPLYSGVGISAKGVKNAGTLGGFLKDENGKCYILSCEHILRPAEMQDSTGHTIVQPAESDYEDKVKSANKTVDHWTSRKVVPGSRDLTEEDIQRMIAQDPEGSYAKRKTNIEKKRKEAKDDLEKVKSKKPRPIAKYVSGLRGNKEFVLDNQRVQVFVDAAIAEVEEVERVQIELEKIDLDEANHCLLYGFEKHEVFTKSPNGYIVNMEELVADPHTNNTELTFIKFGRTTGLTDLGSLQSKAEKMFIKYGQGPSEEAYKSGLTHVPFPSCNICSQFSSNQGATSGKDGIAFSTQKATPDKDGIVSSNKKAALEKNGIVSSNEEATPEKDGIVSSNEEGTPEESHKCANCENKSLWTRNCLMIGKLGKPFCEEGDSGALVFDSDGRAWGLVFGQFMNLSAGHLYCVASPLCATLKALESESAKKLELWIQQINN